MNQQNLVRKQLLFHKRDGQITIKHIYLRNFRNYEEATVAFGPGLNVIYGDNAQGKTNLLEAISLISTGRSFRTQHLAELIQEGKTFFYLEAEIIRDKVLQTIKLSFDGKAKKIHLNASEFPTFTPLLGAFPSIFSLPNDIELITDSPMQRRRIINLHLAQSDPLYVHHLARFWRAMKQRNCLLKAKTMDTLDCWETEMAHSAQYIFEARKKLLEQLKEPLAIQSNQLSSNTEIIEIHFQPAYPSLAQDYEQQLKKMRKREKELGLTLQGPHRDDFTFMINAKSARTFASEGQKKTMITALRLSQWQHLANKSETIPLFAIDDYEGTLDTYRQKHLNTFLQSMGQVFLTTPAHPQTFVGQEGIAHVHFVNIKNGNISL